MLKILSHVCHEVSQSLIHLPYSDFEGEGVGSLVSKYELVKDGNEILEYVYDENVEDVSPLDGPKIEVKKGSSSTKCP